MEKLLADGRTVLLEQLSVREFSDRAIARFPMIAELREFAGLLHVQTWMLGEELLRRVGCDDTVGAAAVLTFFEEVLDSGKRAPELENALEISFPTMKELSATPVGQEVLLNAPARICALLSPQ